MKIKEWSNTDALAYRELLRKVYINNVRNNSLDIFLKFFKDSKN